MTLRHLKSAATFLLLASACAPSESELVAPPETQAEASEGAFPATGLVRVGGYSCTGTLISADAVLTAAHCFVQDDISAQDVREARFVVRGACQGGHRVGEDGGGCELRESHSDLWGQHGTLAEGGVVLHPDYPENRDADFALMRLASRPAVTPVVLSAWPVPFLPAAP